MSQSAMSLSWEAYQNNICCGLSSLQRDGEYVDMTLAADGYLVKVHRMVMALVSPYIKQLIASVECPQPVIFLNNISYKTLCSLLDYAYTGEVEVANDELNAFIEAGKALHIRGICDMNTEQTFSMLPTEPNILIQKTVSNSTTLNEDEKTKDNLEIKEHLSETEYLDDDMDISYCDERKEESNDDSQLKMDKSKKQGCGSTKVQKPVVQYSVSNHGNLQMVLNRYLYYLVYIGKTAGQRRWQCIDSRLKKNKCDASVVTKNNVILKRMSAHNHTYHDAKILKKIEKGCIFSGIKQAEVVGKTMLEERARVNADSQGDSEAELIK